MFALSSGRNGLGRIVLKLQRLVQDNVGSLDGFVQLHFVSGAAGAIARRSLSKLAKGRGKIEVIRSKYTKHCDKYWDSEEDDLRYDPRKVVFEEEEEDYDPNSLATRLEDHKDGPALAVLHQWIAEGKESHEGVISAMKRLKWLGRFKQAYEISDWVINERPLELQKFHFINHLELLGRVVSMKEAENFRNNKMPKTYANSDAALATMFENYVIHESMSKVRVVLKIMKRKGQLTSPKLFNRLFLLCEKKKKEDRIPALLKDMKDLQIAPDVETYTILISLKAKSGDLEGMERLFSKMKSDGDGVPTGEVLCALASGYVNAGVHEKAMACLKQVVEDEAFFRSRKVHDKVIALYAAMGKGDMVDRVWRFTRKFPVISADSFLATISAYEKVKQVDKAEKVFEELLEKKERLKPIHFAAMFRAYAEAGQMKKAEKLVERMHGRNLRVNNLCYHNLISGYMKCGSPKMAVESLKKMLDERLGPCFDTMMLVLDHHCKGGDVSNAELLFQEMRRQSYTKNVDAYNRLLQTYINAGKHAYRFLQRMATDRVAPNADTYAMLNSMKPIPKLCQDAALPPVVP